MVRESKAEQVAQAAMASLRRAVVEEGFDPAPDGDADLFLQPGEATTWLGRAGVHVAGYTNPAGSARPGFEGRIRVVIFSERVVELRRLAYGDDDGRLAVAIDLAALERGNRTSKDQRALTDASRADDFAAHTMQRVRGYSGEWFRRFATRDSTFDYLLDVADVYAVDNWVTGLLLALDEGQREWADRFAAAFAEIWPVGTSHDYYKRVEGRIAKIESWFDVSLPFPRVTSASQ